MVSLTLIPCASLQGPLRGPSAPLSLHRPGARPMAEARALEILAECRRQKTAFFFKQWGGVHKKAAGRRLQGKLYDEMPPLPGQQGQLLLDMLAS